MIWAPNSEAIEGINRNFNKEINKQVCVVSYNSRGFKQMHQDFIKTLVSDKVVGDKVPILCNQENVILKGNYYKILQTLSGFHLFINSAVKNSFDKGRPKGGMFIAVPNFMKSQVSDVSPGHWRVQAIVISSADSKTLLIGVAMVRWNDQKLLFFQFAGFLLQI